MQVDIAQNLIVSSIISAVTIGFLYLITRKNKNTIAKFFEGHVNDPYLKKIIKNSSRISVSGEEKIITTMFIDIRGFTALSEQMPNKKLFEVLNFHLNKIAKIIIKNNGTVDKFLGDGTMAFWGAPLHDKYQATNALRAAFEIKKYFDTTELGIGVGVNTGPAILGRVGAERMISYTAIGDSINLSARIESLNKLYGTCILISDKTHDRLMKEPRRFRPDIFIREVDKVKVYGKNKSTFLFELVDLKEHIDMKAREGYEWFDMGLAAYRKGFWHKAEQYFRFAQKRLGPDQVCKTYIERCKHFAISPPVGRWDGSISLNKI